MDEQRLNIKQFIAEMWIHWVVAVRYSVSLRINRILSNAISNIVLFFFSFSLTFMCTSFLFYTFIIRFRNLIFRPASISNKFGQITANIFIFFNFFLCGTLCAAHSTTLSIDEREKKTQQKLGQKDERFATCFVSETKSFYVVDILPNNRSCKLYFLALINWMSKVKWYIIESSFVKFVLAYSTILLLLLTLIQFRFVKKHFFKQAKKREKKNEYKLQTNGMYECVKKINLFSRWSRY